MENIVMNIAIQYAKARGLNKITDEAIKYAYEKLGMDQSNQNPEFTYGMPFTNNKVSINPIRMIANQGIKSLTGGGSMGMGLPLLAGGLGLGYYRNPLRKGAPNYNPNLKGQMDYLSSRNMLGTDQSGLTKYGSDSILSGQNVVSLFGTNDYLDQLNKYKSKYKNTMPKNRLDKLNKEIADYELAQVNKELKEDAFKNLQNINAGNNDNDNTGGDSGSRGASDQFSNRSGRGRTGYGRGGIASL